MQNIPYKSSSFHFHQGDDKLLVTFSNIELFLTRAFGWKVKEENWQTLCKLNSPWNSNTGQLFKETTFLFPYVFHLRIFVYVLFRVCFTCFFSVSSLYWEHKIVTEKNFGKIIHEVCPIKGLWTVFNRVIWKDGHRFLLQRCGRTCILKLFWNFFCHKKNLIRLTHASLFWAPGIFFYRNCAFIGLFFFSFTEIYFNV